MAEILEALEQVRRAKQEFRAWIDVLANSPDPFSRRLHAIESMSRALREVDRAVQFATPGMITSREWNTEIAAYTDTLRELRTTLCRMETEMRVRRTQLARERERAWAVDAWARLARQVG